MKGIRKDMAKLYSFYFMFWGFYFSASYFCCQNKYKFFSNEYINIPLAIYTRGVRKWEARIDI